MPQTSQRASLDAVHHPKDGRSGQQFMSNFPELLPLDLPSSAGSSSDASGTPASVHRQLSSGFTSGPSSAGATVSNPLVKLNAMMFPSGDPFAYPNQPLEDVIRQGQVAQSGQASGSQDSMQFYMPNMYDDIEGQLLGPIPPYLVQPGQEQHALDLSSQMYNTSSMLTLQQSQSQSPSAQQTAQQQQQQDREMQELLSDPHFKGDWGGTFANNNYRSQ